MANTIVLNVTDAQEDALRVMGKAEDAQAIAEATFASRIKGAITTYRNGNKMRDANGDVVKVNGVEQYKGGMKQKVEQAYDMLAATMTLPIKKSEFVASQLAEVDAIIARISAKETASEDVEDSE